MQQNKTLFNSILFNPVAAGEALKGKKQRLVIDKLNSLNSLFITRSLKHSELVEKAHKIKSSLQKELKAINTENAQAFSPVQSGKKLETTQNLLNESKYVKFKNFNQIRSPNMTLKSEIYLNELINTRGKSLNKYNKKTSIDYPVIKNRELSLDAYRLKDINDRYKERSTVKEILEVEKFVVKPFKYK